MDELKPCPFCGSDELIICESTKREYYFVNCYYCGAESGGCAKRKDALAEWNKRAGDLND